MATLLSGTDKATGTTINIPANDIVTVSQSFGSTDCIVNYVSNKGINTQVILESKDIDACAFQGGEIDGIVPVVADTLATVVTGTATAGGADEITLTGTSATNDVYNNMYVYITEGTGIGQVRKISDYVGATKVATVENAWTVQPDNTSVYLVVETGSLIQSQKIGLVDVTGGLFLYNDNGAAKLKVVLNSDQDATAFVSYVNTAIDEAAATYVTLSTVQTITGSKTFSAQANFTNKVVASSSIAAAGALSTTLVTDSTSSSTGSLKTAGGLGVAKAAHIGTTLGFGGPLIAEGTPQTLTDAGAVSLTTYSTLLVTTGAAAITLADGSEGQFKFIRMKTYGGDATCTVTNLQGGTTITFDTAGDFVHLFYQDAKWHILTNSGCTVA